MDDNTKHSKGEKEIMYSVQLIEDAAGNPVDLDIAYTTTNDRACFIGLMEHFMQRLVSHVQETTDSGQERHAS